MEERALFGGLQWWRRWRAGEARALRNPGGADAGEEKKGKDPTCSEAQDHRVFHRIRLEFES